MKLKNFLHAFSTLGGEFFQSWVFLIS